MNVLARDAERRGELRLGGERALAEELHHVGRPQLLATLHVPAIVVPQYAGSEWVSTDPERRERGG
jgi:hypothetical protein